MGTSEKILLITLLIIGIIWIFNNTDMGTSLTTVLTKKLISSEFLLSSVKAISNEKDMTIGQFEENNSFNPSLGYRTCDSSTTTDNCNLIKENNHKLFENNVNNHFIVGRAVVEDVQDRNAVLNIPNKNSYSKGFYKIQLSDISSKELENLSRGETIYFRGKIKLRDGSLDTIIAPQMYDKNTWTCSYGCIPLYEGKINPDGICSDMLGEVLDCKSIEKRSKDNFIKSGFNCSNSMNMGGKEVYIRDNKGNIICENKYK